MRDQDMFLAQALIEAGHLTAERLEEIRAHGLEHELDLIDALTATETVDGKVIALTRADVCEVPFVELDDFEASFANTQYLPQAFAERFDVYALHVINDVLTLAMDDPLNLDATDQARQISQCDIDAVQCERGKLRNLIARAYSLGRYEEEKKLEGKDYEADLKPEDSSQPAVTAVNQMLTDAVEQCASDIHINPDETVLHLRYRIDGVLREKQGPPLSLHPAIVQRLKVMARLDLTQTKRPHDGKFRFNQAGMNIDVRLSSIPTVCGENIVMRLLRNTNVIHDYKELGIPATLTERLGGILAQPYGMLLVTGPTGSGKTTTLYTALNQLNDPSRNIMTIENPVEIRLPYVRQIQTHEEIGMTFASALRSILRQDPDIVLVGEIRDAETAKIAAQASLTGHMVLSTLHTNDAAGSIDRLRDFGIPSFVINSSLLGVIAQRLVRKVCSECTEPDDPDELTLRRFNLLESEQDFMKGRGCPRCAQTGYRGRIGLYELLTMSPDIRNAIDNGGTIETIRRLGIAAGMRLMWEDGLDKARLGQTTLAEVGKAATIIEFNATEVDEERRSA